ncbi:YaaR family protein (plasmid) [Radiobacillus kanasensis]|uniref:YaaR family protein n=1 Tax=Radiobacillus kanasensis TaxID=2844358 RepID=UPI001E63E0C9|nr:YaaR family protein [Radiobacillus kanasensis]UFU01502.1 YaaR family protein [Radiobacillus kanasensis]
MKIGQDLRSQLESTRKNVTHPNTSAKSFDSMVSAQSHKLKQQELTKLMTDLSAQGEKVAQHQSFRDLAKYKRLVKKFVKEAVQYGMDLKHSHSWTSQGSNRKLTIVEQVDEKLIELTEAVMDQEKKQIDILGLIGEIKGLLINIYG